MEAYGFMSISMHMSEGLDLEGGLATPRALNLAKEGGT